MIRGRAVPEDLAERMEIFTENKKQFKKHKKVVKKTKNRVAGLGKRTKQRTSGSFLKIFFKWR